MSKGKLRRWAPLALAALLAGCGGGSDWQHLSEAYRPPETQRGSVPMSDRHADGNAARWTLEPSAEPAGWWLRVDYVASDWIAGPREGLWLAVRGVRALGILPEDRAVESFHVDDVALNRRRVQEGLEDLGSLRPGDWGAVGHALVLFTEGAPPLRAHSRVWVPAGHRENGAWRVDLPGASGEGFVLPVGASQRFELELDGPSIVRFACQGQAAFPEEIETQAATLTVRWRGEVLSEQSVPLLAAPRPVRMALELPAGAKRGTLEFEARGPAGVLCVLAPVVGPKQFADYRQRAAQQRGRRPDMILFLADTLRADALSAYAGMPSRPPAPVSPNLDRFARSARVFERAWSPSPWTLPSHGTLFTGLYPEQHGALNHSLRLSRDLVTLAERLRAAGYRTEATADTGFMEPVFGLDQGFEVYLTRQTHVTEQERAMPNLLAMTERALDADDGRPLFLFAHTFRVHAPYLAEPETILRLALQPEFTTSWSELQSRVYEDFPGSFEVRSGVDVPALMQRFGEELRWRYYSGVHDLDRGFAEFEAQLEKHGLLENGTVVFTSDHGEGFGELDSFLHGNSLVDGVTRIPLLVRSPSLESGVDLRSVSLADVHATLCDLAGVELPQMGPGRSLRSPGPSRVIHQYMNDGVAKRAAVDWPHRYIWDEAQKREATRLDGPEGEVRLSGIPAELDTHFLSLEAQNAAWAKRFRAPPDPVQITEQIMIRLQNMGYIGD